MTELIESGEITTRQDSEGTSQLRPKKQSSWSGNMLITVRSDVSKSLETQKKVLVRTRKMGECMNIYSQRNDIQLI